MIKYQELMKYYLNLYEQSKPTRKTIIQSEIKKPT